MSISQSLRIWSHVLTHPSERTFEAERQRPEALITTALAWIFFCGIINAVLTYYAVKVEYQLSRGKTLAVIFWHLLATSALVIGLVFLTVVTMLFTRSGW